MPFAGLFVQRFRAEFVLDTQATGQGRNQLLLFRAYFVAFLVPVLIPLSS